MISALKFQSTLPRRERQPSRPRLISASDFNPRSREGSDFYSGGYRREATISIHAPAKGATRAKQLIVTGTEISIHAPAKGATTKSKNKKMLLVVFQSTLPRRERLWSGFSVCSSCIFQSTLPRRERRDFLRFFVRYHNFNPRSREGSDLTLYKSQVFH